MGLGVTSYVSKVEERNYLITGRFYLCISLSEPSSFQTQNDDRDGKNVGTLLMN